MSIVRRLPIEEQIALDRLLDQAFAPARARSATISAARVRARVAWQRETPPSRGWRAVALLGRLGEASLALGMTVILFAGALGGVGAVTEPLPRSGRGGEYVIRVTPQLDESKLVRLHRLGRAVAVIDDFDPATSLAPMAEEGGLVRLIREQGRLIGAPSRRFEDDDDPPVIAGARQGLPR